MFKIIIDFKDSSTDIYYAKEEPIFTFTTPLFLSFKNKNGGGITRINVTEIAAFTVIPLDEMEQK